MEKLNFSNSNIHVVMFHYVREKEKKYPNLKILEFSKFKSQIDFLCKNYNILSKKKFLEIIHSKKLPRKPSILLTFDDGYKDHYDYVFPYLLKKKITASFYVPVNPITNKIVLDVNKIQFILSLGRDPKKIINNIDNFLIKKSLRKLDLDKIHRKILKDGTISPYDDKYTNLIKRVLQYILPKKIRLEVIRYLLEDSIKITEKEFSQKLYLNKKEIIEMHNYGMDFGSHGLAHEYLGKISKKKQENEIFKSKLFFKELGLNTKNFSISYPYGSYNNYTLKILSKAKYKYGFIDGYGTINSTNIEDKFLFPRIDTNMILNK